MAKRIIFGMLMIAGVAALLVLDWWLEHRLAARTTALAAVRGIPVAAAMALLLLKAFLELERLCAASTARVLPISGLAGSLALGLLPFWTQLVGMPLTSVSLTVLLAIILMLIFAEQMVRRLPAEALGAVACTLLVVVYLGVGGAMVLQMRLSFGVQAIAFFLIVVKLTDMAAYFVGSAIGRHKLVPAISPGKSWEGLAAGLIAAAGAGAAAARLLGMTEGGQQLARLPLWQAAVFGLALGLAGQFADLCESLLKRSAGAKDSGAAVPEFGGVLDIIDSVLLAAPVAYILLAAAAK